MTQHEDLFSRAFRLLTYHRRRVWWITSRLFVLTVAVTALRLAVSPKYVARTKLTLLPTRGELGFAAGRTGMFGVSPAMLLGQTHEEAMMSRTLAEDVARMLQSENAADLNNSGALGHVRRWIVAPILGSFRRAVTLMNTGRWEKEDPFAALVNRIRSRTSVQNRPGSFVYQVSATWEKPALAAKIANLITERYVRWSVESGQEEMLATRRYLDEKIRETETKLQALQIRIKEYRTQERVFSVANNASADVDLAMQEVSQSVRDLSSTRVGWEQLSARLEALKPYQAPTALAAIEAERAGLKARQEALEAVMEEQMAKLDKLPAKEAGLLELYRERVLNERALTALQDRMLDTKVAEAAQLATVRILDPAIAPVYPERPLLLRNASTSILVGLLLSMAFVMLTEASHAGLRCREDLGDDGNALLGVVPYVAAGNHGDPDEEAGGPVAEFFRGLVHGRQGTVAYRRMVKRHIENLFLRLAEGDGKGICLVISPSGGEGKTFLVEQLARLAKEAGRKVLLIDANLNQPALNRAFGKPMSAGLADVLTGAATAKDVVVDVDEGIALICAGASHLNGQARWDLSGSKAQLDSLAAAYDLVLMDAAALRQDPAVDRLCMLSDRTVCVFDADASVHDDLDAVRQRARGSSHAVCFVLNKVRYAADFLFKAGVPHKRS